MTANLNTASYKSASGTQSRTLGARAEDVINVKDFGATGNGVTDDTAAVQAAFDAAFSTWGSTRGANTATSNKAVFFPNGTYLVSARSAAKSVTGTSSLGNTTASSSGGYIRLSFGAAHGLSNGDVVYVRGVGGTLNANGSHQISEASSVATAFTLAVIPFDSAWTAGGTVREPCLRIHNVQGGKIFGAGKRATQVITTSSNCATMCAFGFGYSHVHDISWASEAGGIAFDCNGNGQPLPATATDPVSTQSNLFSNCQFSGTASNVGDYACSLGWDQQMGSEITFLDCYVATGSIGGISWHNANALAGTVIGGNFGASSASAGSGILVAAGACPVIQGVSFQNYNGTDINIQWGANDAYTITGCRTESDNFVQGPSVTEMGIHIAGCSMTASVGTGFFYNGSCRVSIDACQVTAGHYVSGNPHLTINNSSFGSSTYLTDGPENFSYLEIHPQPQITVTSTQTTIPSNYGGHKVIYTNANPMSAVLLKNSDASNRLDVGSFIDVQRGGAGTVTFSSTAGVTITAQSSLRSLNGYGAVGRLTCDGTDSWTLSGQLV